MPARMMYWMDDEEPLADEHRYVPPPRGPLLRERVFLAVFDALDSLRAFVRRVRK